jgi:hypothetical protein
MPNQSLDIPPGNYTYIDCGIDIQIDNVVIKSSLRNVVIDCAGADRHFIIGGSNVTIEGLLLANGASSSGKCSGDQLSSCPSTSDGGCMLIHGNHTLIRNNIFMNCSAAQNGGAISVTNLKSVVKLEGVSILQSEATLGGGVWSRGLLTLENCSLAFNSAKMHGGAIFIQGTEAMLVVRQTVVSSNTAYGGCGGGISMMVRNEAVTDCRDQELVTPDGGSAILNEVTMQNNWALTFGGAIFSQDGFTLSLEGTTANETRFARNIAWKGGAIFSLFSQSISIFGRVCFFDNTALAHGGALYLRCSCSGTIVGGDIRFENNLASMEEKGHGGAILLSDTTILDISGNVSFVSNLAPAGSGGALHTQINSLCMISGSVSFVQNLAIGGGAISNCWAGSIVLSGDVKFINNSALAGGALDVETDSAVRIFGQVSFVGNRGVRVTDVVSAFAGESPLTPSWGGAIYVSTASLDCWGNVTFEDNTADLGGGIHAYAGADVAVGESVSFHGCAANSGGALFLRSSTAWIGGETLIQGNTAEKGGGLFAW